MLKVPIDRSLTPWRGKSLQSDYWYHLLNINEKTKQEEMAKEAKYFDLCLLEKDF